MGVQMTYADNYVQIINDLPDTDHPDDVIQRDTVTEMLREQVCSDRWTKTIQTVYLCDDDSYFAVDHDEGLTEDQECLPVATAYRVHPKTAPVVQYERTP